VVGGGVGKSVQARSLAARIADAKLTRGWIVAPDLARARTVIASLPALAELELEISDLAGLADAIDAQGMLDGRRVVAMHVARSADAEEWLARRGAFEIVLSLTRASEAWLRALATPSPRLVLRQLTHERLTESAQGDVDLTDFFASFRHDVPVIGVPACVIARSPRQEPPTLDASMLSSDGALEVFRFTRRHIEAGYMTKALRCRTCVHDATCAGMHVNYVRAHGYGLMRPVLQASGA
jgi:hypothetical protein